MGIRNDCGNQLGTARRASLARPVHRRVPPRLLLAARKKAGLSSRQRGLHLLVQCPLQRRLRNAEVARAHALVQAAQALVAQDLAHAVPRVTILTLHGAAAALRDVLVELQARLDHPDGVGGRRGGDTGNGTGRNMHPRGLLATVPVFRHEALAVTVDEEVDATRGDDADQVGPQTLEQRAPALGAVDGGQDVDGVAEVVHRGARRVEPDGDLGFGGGGTGSSELGLVDIGLQSGFQDVEWRGEGCGRHASDSVRSVDSQQLVMFPQTPKPATARRDAGMQCTHAPAIICTHDLAKGKALVCFPVATVSSGVRTPVSRDWIRAACSAGACACSKGRSSRPPTRRVCC